MTTSELQRLESERGELERLLSQVPPANVIDRLSLDTRLSIVNQALAASSPSSRQPARARLTFRGRPVVGNYGIFAEFGATAVNQFVDAIASLAASLSGPLGTRGTLPNRDNYRILITGTAIGSFGFELEEHSRTDELPFGNPSPVEEAVEQASRIMKATLGTDDELADAASAVDPRAISSLREFVEFLKSQEAVCSLEFGTTEFHFSDVGEVRRSAARLSRDAIHEQEKLIEGQFLGVLPNRRAFEFRMSDTNEVIAGKVGGAIANAAEINRTLDRPLNIRVMETRVGSGRPRYRLLSYSGQAD